MIAHWGARMNLTSEPDNPQELSFHIIDSLMPIILANDEELLRQAFSVGNHVLDLGSGAGFPGLVLASASAANFTLTESRRKRSSFLALAAAEMKLINVRVQSQRITPGHLSCGSLSADGRTGVCGYFDVVAARGYAVPRVFHATAGAALRRAGIAILYGNRGQELDSAEAAKNGLIEFRPLNYTVSRQDSTVARILGLWRRQ